MVERPPGSRALVGMFVVWRAGEWPQPFFKPFASKGNIAAFTAAASSTIKIWLKALRPALRLVVRTSSATSTLANISVIRAGVASPVTRSAGGDKENPPQPPTVPAASENEGFRAPLRRSPGARTDSEQKNLCASLTPSARRAWTALSDSRYEAHGLSAGAADKRGLQRRTSMRTANAANDAPQGARDVTVPTKRSNAISNKRSAKAGRVEVPLCQVIETAGVCRRVGSWAGTP